MITNAYFARLKSKRFLSKAGWVLSFVGVFGLQGCGVPGYGFLRPTSGGQPSASGFQSDGAPDGAVIPISLELVRAMALSQPKSLPADVRALFGKPSIYTIGPGDVIGILVYDHPELLPTAGAVISQQTDPTGVSVAPGFIVGSSGDVSFPYVGRVRVQGLTEIDAEQLITRCISEYIKDPQVTVRIQAFRSRRAYVEGEVRTPGLQVFTDVPMTLAEAISRSGGITSNGDRSFVTLSREGKTIVIDLAYLQDVGADANKIPLKSGDVINVRNRDERKVYVMGEILRPSALLMRNGKISLNEALGESGGLNLATSNPGQIYVIRNNAEGSPQIYQLDAKNPSLLALADQFLLQPRDVVYIDPVPLVMWSRLVNLILPSAQVVYYGGQATK